MDIEKAEMKKWKSREDNLIRLRSISIVGTYLTSEYSGRQTDFHSRNPLGP
jgi:hypothetical protein